MIDDFEKQKQQNLNFYNEKLVVLEKGSLKRVKEL